MAKRGSTTGKKTTTSRTASRSAPATKRAARPAARPAAPRSAASSSRSASRSTSRSATRPAEPVVERAPRRRAPVLPSEPSPVEAPIVMPNLSPSEMYQREKSRREAEGRVTSDPIAEARREYLALLAAEAAAGKGGRPKGSGRPRPGAAPAASKMDDDE